MHAHSRGGGRFPRRGGTRSHRVMLDGRIRNFAIFLFLFLIDVHLLVRVSSAGMVGKGAQSGSYMNGKS